MAIPGLFRPVEMGGYVLIDGGAVNPLPYDLLFERADVVLAVDVTYGGRSRVRRVPSPLDAMLGAAQIMQGSIIAEKTRLRPPHIVVRPDVEHVLAFWISFERLRFSGKQKAAKQIWPTNSEHTSTLS